MKYLVQAIAGALIVVLALFAVADAYRSGVSYATAVLSITAAILAMIALFTAPDAARLHGQLDELRQEVKAIREVCQRADAVPPRQPQTQPALPRGRHSTRTIFLAVVAALVAAAALRRRSGRSCQ